MLGNRDFYTQEDFTLDDSISFFDVLKNSVIEDISCTEVIVFPVLGASLKKGEKCIIGSVEFTSKSDFLEQYGATFERLRNSEYSEVNRSLDDMFQKSDLVAQVKIKNRDSSIARNATDEAMKRIYTLIRIIFPRVDFQYQFLGTLGEEYLETRYSFSMKLNDLEDITSLTAGRTMNSFSDSGINLLETVSKYRPRNDGYEKGRKWFIHCESIISSYVNGEKMTKFPKRVWTALYWFGETMVEREVNSLIIKYATCLEALFNSREGGISEQIAEFTAFVCGHSKDERIYIYDNIKNLYKLRSTAVHGGDTGISIDNNFLGVIQGICESAVVSMSYYSCEKRWLDSKGYQNFIRHILREYRFSIKGEKDNV